MDPVATLALPPELRLLARVRHVRPDAEIHAEGMPAICWHRIVGGTVRLCMTTPDGRRSVVALLSAGDVFGLEQADVTMVGAEAATLVTLETYATQETRQLAEESAAVAQFLQAAVAARCAALHARILELCCLSATERLARYLLSVWRRGGGARRLALDVSRRDLADHLGIRSETMSRAISQLRRDGILGLDRFDAITLLAPDRLCEIAGVGGLRSGPPAGLSGDLGLARVSA